MYNREKAKRLGELIEKSERIVFFGGAGVSTESGIKDFRSTDGLYSEQYEYPPETILSHSFFERMPEVFFRFYRDKLSLGGARPNAAHEYLAKLEAEGKLTAVITQNIDGLHQAAGSVNVLELHGTLLRSYCAKCRREHPTKSITDLCGAVPRCACGGIIRPDVVLYEEGLDDDVVSRAVHHIRQADLLIVGGTSLVVYPAAGLLRYYRGSELVLINKAATPYDSDATLIINDAIGEVLGAIMRKEV